MAPIRRYLRITKYSVLECRIYLENPADTRWLLSSREPVLPRIFSAIKPHVLPKLREENERALGKKKRKPVKDVIVEDDFEVAIFLRESGTRHSILTRQKTFAENKKIESNSNKLMGTEHSPIHVADETDAARRVIADSDAESEVDLHDIPEASSIEAIEENPSKRRRTLTVSDDPSDAQSATKRTKRQDETENDTEDEKKLGMITTYEGFNIWGWVLCLLVTRKGERARNNNLTSETTGQVLLEEWISTQAPGGVDDED
ncbi:hypothetical protein CIMG_08085 [Paecilomyces variotii No. 5]|uniref:Uncharacterized protein n=1 Tax=Byssochlamys spectabilis (strain No. 5 / NBRC 109023) TaxID=1356009 RepID=V5FKZ8_BYSSN|nr:hypothetical protein CIMG_08085 [Paecilomyces variotii No. 5]